MRKLMYILSFTLLAIVLVTVGILLVYSPGKQKPFLDENHKEIPGSISEKIHVNINGVEQGMFIKSKGKNLPVLLFLHGGPGMPEYAISREYPLVLENHFTVCWWEQRGAGLSFKPGMQAGSLTFEQLIADVLQVTNYLRERFGQEKIYLMGHSGGTFIGIQAADRAPHLYNAYIGMSQISNQLESEKLAYQYMVDHYSKLSDQKMLKKFAKYPIQEINSPSYYTMRDAPMHSLGIGTTRAMKSVIGGVFLPVMLNKEYTLREKINIWRGKFFISSKANLWCQLVETDLNEMVRKLDIPVYFLHGSYDYTTSYPLAKEFFQNIEAPSKGFYTFHQSAHSPLFEEPEKTELILQQDVLLGKNNLADIH